MSGWLEIDRSRIEFVPLGSSLPPQEDAVILDVGNRFVAGVFDHHQPGAPSSSATGLVAGYPEMLLDHLQDISADEVRFVVHERPDFDCVASLYLSLYLINNQKSHPLARSLAALADSIDSGRFSEVDSFETSPYCLFLGLMNMLHGEGAPDLNYLRIRKGLEFIDLLLQEAQQKDNYNLWRVDLSGRYPDAWTWCSCKRQRYQEDLSHSTAYPIVLPRASHPEERVDYQLLVCRNPGSSLFRLFARFETPSESAERGFATFINYDDRRFIISVDPELDLSLRGLGDELQEREEQRRKEKGKTLAGEVRPGYDSPDPWYDGRNTFHKYSIIDTPRGGTLLKPQEVLETALRFLHPWQAIKTEALKTTVILLQEAEPASTEVEGSAFTAGIGWNREGSFFQEDIAGLFYPYVGSCFEMEMKAGNLSVFEKNLNMVSRRFDVDLSSTADEEDRHQLFVDRAEVKLDSARCIRISDGHMIWELDVCLGKASEKEEFRAAEAVDIFSWFEGALKNKQSPLRDWLQKILPELFLLDQSGFLPFFMNILTTHESSHEQWNKWGREVLKAFVSGKGALDHLIRSSGGNLLSSESPPLYLLTPTNLTLASSSPPEPVPRRGELVFMKEALRLAFYLWSRLLVFSRRSSRLKRSINEPGGAARARALQKEMKDFVNGCRFSEVSPLSPCQQYWRELSSSFELAEQWEKTMKALTEIDEAVKNG